MNRRSFLDSMIRAGVACAFLPGAGRLWKPSREIVPANCAELLGVDMAVGVDRSYSCVLIPPPERELQSETWQIQFQEMKLESVDMLTGEVTDTGLRFLEYSIKDGKVKTYELKPN